MDIHKLKAFVAVVEESNISRAAVRLNMQQPPLTRIIKGLENELNAHYLSAYRVVSRQLKRAKCCIRKP